MIRECICLIFVFLIHLLHQIQPVPYQVAMKNTKTWRREYMAKGCKRLSMLHLAHLLLWLHQPPVDWLMRQHIFINILLRYCLIRGRDKYSLVMGWLQCFLSFSLLCSANQCVHGACSLIWHHVVAPPPMDLVRLESNKSLEDDHRRWFCCKLKCFKIL